MSSTDWNSGGVVVAASSASLVTQDAVRNGGALMDDELTSIADVKAINQSLISGASPTLAIANMTLDDTSLVVVNQTNLQTWAEGVDHSLLKARGTGVTDSYVSSVTVGGTTFDHGAVYAEIRSDQGYFDDHYLGATGITVTNLTAASTYVYIDNTNVLRQQVTTPTAQDWNRKVFTMRIAVDLTSNTIIGFEYLNNPIGNYTNSIRDIYSYLLAQGVPMKKEMEITGRASLGFNIAAGSFLEFGGTGDINSPNVISFPAIDDAPFFLARRTSFDAGGNTTIPKFWDNNDSLTAIGSTTLVGHRLYRFSNGNLVMQYGQGNYANIVLCRAGILLENYVLNPILKNATFLGWWLIESTATNTSGTVKTEFREYTIGVQGGSSSGLTGAALRGNNLSDLLDATVARTNLGIDPFSTLSTNALPKSGGTVTGDINMSNNNITGINNLTADTFTGKVVTDNFELNSTLITDIFSTNTIKIDSDKAINFFNSGNRMQKIDDVGTILSGNVDCENIVSTNSSFDEVKFDTDISFLSAVGANTHKLKWTKGPFLASAGTYEMYTDSVEKLVCNHGSGNIWTADSTDFSVTDVLKPLGGINMGGVKILNVGTPTDTTDGVNKTYVDTAVAGAGGTEYYWGADFVSTSANNNAEATVVWNNTTIVKAGSGWGDTTTPYDGVIVPVAGRYLLTGTIWFSNNNNGYRTAWFKNNTANKKYGRDARASVQNLHDYVTITAVVNLAANDEIAVQVTQNSGGVLNVGYFENGSFTITKI
jgi:hypothetical protein